jgi:hypothetical protein
LGHMLQPKAAQFRPLYCCAQDQILNIMMLSDRKTSWAIENVRLGLQLGSDKLVWEWQWQEWAFQLDQ